MTAEQEIKFKTLVRRFLASFLEIGTKGNVTPYIHWVVHHAIHHIHSHGPLGLYTCQQMEMHNSHLRTAVHRHTNHRVADRVRDPFLNELLSQTLEIAMGEVYDEEEEEEKKKKKKMEKEERDKDDKAEGI